ncbi:hypothetical protein BLA24064_06311 [Burkholderia latens]|uniref:Uncharacterized protein n=1 Tax=Burkholderia latens TaxID=488446 RepID=A0A6P2R6P0_9BURK|nr:hypothetical protein BLA24064_06311 [Burkholderia latens]
MTPPLMSMWMESVDTQFTCRAALARTVAPHSLFE